MDSDRPPELRPWRNPDYPQEALASLLGFLLLDIPGWFLGLWPALKERVHSWLHNSIGESCAGCAERDRWILDTSQEALHLEELLAAEQAKREIAPGTPVLGGPEEGLVSYADLTPRKPNLEQVIANMAGAPKPVAIEAPEESRPLTYPEVIAMQPPKPAAVIPEAMFDAARVLAAPPADSWGRVNLLVPDLVLTKGEQAMGCTVIEADAAAQINAALALEEVP